jgi:hypothetical protein
MEDLFLNESAEVKQAQNPLGSDQDAAVGNA